jgi:hypothetical protein
MEGSVGNNVASKPEVTEGDGRGTNPPRSEIQHYTTGDVAVY